MKPQINSKGKRKRENEERKGLLQVGAVNTDA
jgi:hypothetical protein